MEKTAQLDKWTAMRRGLKGDCPKCDDAKLFQSYLKPDFYARIAAEALDPPTEVAHIQISSRLTEGQALRRQGNLV